MPKISMPQISGSSAVRATIDEIQAAIVEIEYLLAGRLDVDNLWEDGDSKVAISPKSVVDMADPTRPIDGMKFFGHLSTEDGVEEKIFTPLIDGMTENKRLFALQAETAYSISEAQYLQNQETAVIKTPPNFKLLRYKDLENFGLDLSTSFFETNKNDPVVFLEYFLDTGETVLLAIVAAEVLSITPESTSFSVESFVLPSKILSPIAFDDTYYTVNTRITALYQEMP